MFAVLQEMDNILVMNKQQVIVMVYGYKVFFVTALNHKITFFKNYTAGGQNIKNINKKIIVREESINCIFPGTYSKFICWKTKVKQ